MVHSKREKTVVTLQGVSWVFKTFRGVGVVLKKQRKIEFRVGLLGEGVLGIQNRDVGLIHLQTWCGGRKQFRLRGKGGG